MRARLRANWKRENAHCRRATAQAAGEAQSQSDPAVDVHGVPPFPIDRHLGASPEVAPDYWSRRGVGRFKRAGEGLGKRPAAGMVNNFHLPSEAADPEGTYGA